MEIFTFMVLNRRLLDLEMEHRRKGGWNTQKEFQHPIKLTPYLICKSFSTLKSSYSLHYKLKKYVALYSLLCSSHCISFWNLFYICVFIMLFIIFELLLLCSLCNEYAHRIAIIFELLLLCSLCNEYAHRVAIILNESLKILKLWIFLGLLSCVFKSCFKLNYLWTSCFLVLSLNLCLWALRLFIVSIALVKV